MRKTLKVFKYRCDIRGAVQEVEIILGNLVTGSQIAISHLGSDAISISVQISVTNAERSSGTPKSQRTWTP